MSLAFNVSVFCSYYMTGMIWLIQFIGYPVLYDIDGKKFLKFHQRHTSAMSTLVGPIMVIELVAALFLAASLEAFWLLNFALVLILWGCTFVLSVPIHNRLSRLREDLQIQALIRSNWPRTFFWSFKSCLLFYVQMKVTRFVE
jgi:hypothetical protein